MISAKMIDEKLLEKQHKDAVDGIQKRVKHFYDQGKHFRVYHGSTSSTRPLNFDKESIVDVSGMSRMFPVDTASKTVRVEPKVPMDVLLAHTLSYGMVPEVVMELKGITAGGGFSGTSGESSSFKYGMFQDTCSEIEIVLGDGTVTTASATYQNDLLHSAGGSMGTMGIVTLLTVRLVPATSHVDLELHTITDPKAIPIAMEDAIRAGDVDFIDAIYYRKNTAVLMLGRMTDKPSDRVLKKRHVHWFADSVLDIITKPGSKNVQTISMTITDYFFRYDHGGFWGGKLAFQHFHIPNNRITRKLADPLLDSRTCYHALHKTGLANEYLVQDFGLPISNIPTFISWVNENLPHLQIFMCPGMSIDQFDRRASVNPRFLDKASERIIGIGVYGRGPSDPTAFVELNRRLETKAFELLGVKLLYARVYCSEEEFWATYNKDYYVEQRIKYKATTLPDIYQKLAADMSKMPKLRPIRGIVETVFDKVVGNKEYILSRKK